MLILVVPVRTPNENNHKLAFLRLFGFSVVPNDAKMILKKKFHYFFSLAFLKLKGKSQTIPNSTVYIAFKSKFPTATYVQWGQIDVFKWQASFIYGKKQQIALFDSTGTWLETTTVLPFQTIPVGVQESFTRKYNVAGLQNIYHVQTPHTSIFEVQWSDGVFVKRLLFDHLGKITGKVIVPEHGEGI